MSLAFLNRVSAVLLIAEGIGIIALAALEIAAILRGDIESLAGAWGLVVLIVASGVIVVVFGFACARGSSWGRSGGILTQLMVLAVALGAITGEGNDYGFAAMLSIPAVIILALLFTATSRAGKAARREAQESEASAEE